MVLIIHLATTLKPDDYLYAATALFCRVKFVKRMAGMIFPDELSNANLRKERQIQTRKTIISH